MIRTGLIASTIALTLMAGIMYLAFTTMPTGTQIPLHWGIDGSVDRYGTRMQALLSLAIIPAVALFTTIVLAGWPSIDPRKGNLRKSKKPYVAKWVATMALLTMVHAGMSWTIIRGAGTPDLDPIPFVRFVIAGSAALFLILGNYLPKSRSNWFIGIRTPWTLSSENAWEKTHQLAGRLFMLIGVLGMIGAFLLNGLWLALMLPAMAIPTTLICVIYSYLVWRKSDDKHLGADLIV